MINNKKIIAIITARSGSKGLKNKNILSLHGKPLVAWPIGAALQSKYIDKVLVSTDDKDIAAASVKELDILLLPSPNQAIVFPSMFPFISSKVKISDMT